MVLGRVFLIVGLSLIGPLLIIQRATVLAFIARSRPTSTGTNAFHHKVPSSSLFSTTSSSSTETTKTKPPTVTSPAERAARAADTWTTVALQPTQSVRESIDLLKDAKISNEEAFKRFCRVKGTYYINGLASCKIGDRIMHPFEAHGHVKSFAFDGDGRLIYRGRLVETELAKQETSAQKPLARGVMSTVADTTFPSNLLNMVSSSERDTASLISFLWPPPSSLREEEVDDTGDDGDGAQEQFLICLCDNGEPYALDPKTLKTRGKLVDLVPHLEQILGGKKLLAHHRIDDDVLVLCASTLDVPGQDYMGNTTMEFFEFDNKFRLLQTKNYTTRFMVFHDWQMTQDYYVVPLNPAVMQWWPQMAEFLTGTGVGTQIFRMDETCPGAFILIPRDVTDTNVYEVQAKDFFNIFHFGPVNQRDEKLTLYGAAFDSYTFGREMGYEGANKKFDPIDWAESGDAPAPRLDKYVIDLKTMSIDECTRLPVTEEDVPVDMPCFSNEDGGVAYFLGASRPEGWFPFRSVVKMDLATKEAWNWDAGDSSVMSEPMIARDEALDTSFVLSVMHSADTKTCQLVVWEEPSFEAGPIATIPLGQLTPWCVHGVWYPGYNPI
uniref:Carotenoid oxygenase n=1 Tax=Grammatophora oceanica TaxID=210454 RepID=A0A7S1Y854_9STRA|mmetsp:Transcript_29901/g.44161  ORF Transcript_29901/g.44161 Transcript_29901/m.44161 type:complete len:609 (+) Transcript_29901:137-1963(+)